MNSNRSFRGFTEETIRFLHDVREQNSKEWFERNRPVYERELLEPMRDLVADLSDTMLFIDPELKTRPAVGKTISRIHRDTRFSRVLVLAARSPCSIMTNYFQTKAEIDEALP